MSAVRGSCISIAVGTEELSPLERLRVDVVRSLLQDCG